MRQLLERSRKRQTAPEAQVRQARSFGFSDASELTARPS
jgi:hypothetical protein